MIKHRFNLKTEKQADVPSVVPSDVSAVSVNEILAPCEGPTRGLHGYMFPILYVQNQSPVRSGKNESQSQDQESCNSARLFLAVNMFKH